MPIKTPAFILDESQLIANLTTLAQLRQQSGCKVLYAVKALPCSRVLDITKPFGLLSEFFIKTPANKIITARMIIIKIIMFLFDFILEIMWG